MAVVYSCYSCCIGSFWQVLASLYSPPMEISVRTSETVESHAWGRLARRVLLSSFHYPYWDLLCP